MWLDSSKQPLSVVKAAGASSVGIDIAGGSAAGLGSDWYLSRYAAVARKLGLRAFADGLDTPAAKQRCSTLGIDYLGGRAFSELSDYVGPAAARQNGVSGASQQKCVAPARL